MSKFFLLLHRLNVHRKGFFSAIKNYHYYKEQYMSLVQPALQRGECVCVCPASLGDTLLFCEYKKALEKKYQVKCFLLLKHSHAFIPSLCGITNYAAIKDMAAFLRWLILYHKGKNLGYKNKIGFKVLHPQKNTVFVAHPDFSCLYRKEPPNKEEIPGRLFIRFLLVGFGLSPNTPLNPILSLDSIAPACVEEKTILLAPEANSLYLPNASSLWIEIAKRLRAKGFQVVYNALTENKNLSRYATWLNCNLEQAISVAKSAQRIISLRSGFCDLIESLGNKLTVLYPSYEKYQEYGLEGIFGKHGIHEYVVESTDKLLKQLDL